ncbi:MAG: hypothetical protein FWH03_06165 [Firmicutes bacterium]|nr:hypothetical protein [Bacillota bacterium]
MSSEYGKCTTCGAALNMNTHQERIQCMYCGNWNETQKAVQKVQVDGIATFDTHMLAAQQAIEFDNDFDKARKKYREALELKPSDYRVFGGLFQCELVALKYYKQRNGYVKVPGDLNQCIDDAIQRWGKRAHDLAPDDSKEYYAQKIEEANQLKGGKGGGKKKGCYIATAVYGSYNCPQVYTLRRYRDQQLASTRRGRLFIKLYYAFSPLLIKLFGKTTWFNNFWKKRLDKKVAKLQDKGVSDTPYND